MPALPPFAPWIKAPDETGNFATGFQLQQHALALQAQKEEAAQRIELAKQVQQQNQMQEQQRMLITKQYHEQQAAVNKQKADQAAQVMQMKTKQAADQFASRQRIQQRIAAGEEPSRVYMEEGASAFSSPAGLGTVLKAMAPPPHTTFKPADAASGAPAYFEGPGGHPYFPTAPKITQEQKDDLELRKTNEEIIKSSIKKIDADLDIAEAGGKEDVIARLTQKRIDKMNELRNLFTSKGKDTSSGGGNMKAVLINGKLVLQNPTTESSTTPQPAPPPSPAPTPTSPPSPEVRPTPPGFGPAQLPPSVATPTTSPTQRGAVMSWLTGEGQPQPPEEAAAHELVSGIGKVIGSLSPSNTSDDEWTRSTAAAAKERSKNKKPDPVDAFIMRLARGLAGGNIHGELTPEDERALQEAAKRTADESAGNPYTD